MFLMYFVYNKYRERMVTMKQFIKEQFQQFAVWLFRKAYNLPNTQN